MSPPKGSPILSFQSLLGFAAIYGSVLSQYFLHFSLAPRLGPDEYGYFAIMINVVTIGSLLLQFGFSKGVVKFIGEYSASKHKSELKGLLFSIPTMVFFVSSLLSGIGFLLMKLLMQPSDPYYQLVTWLLLLMPVNTLLLLFQNMARGYRHMGWAFLPQGVILPMFVIAGVYFLPLAERGSINALMWYTLTASVLTLLVLIRVILLPQIWELRNIKASYAPDKWFSTAVPLWFNLGFQQLLQRGDVLLLALMLPPAEVGVYALASRIAKASFLSNRAFSGYSASQISGYFEARETSRLQRTVTLTSRLIFATTLGMTILIFLLKGWIFGLLGTDFLLGQGPLTILLVGYLMAALFASSMVTLEMGGQERQVTRIMGTTVLCTLLALIFVIPQWGILGAATVTSLGLIVRSLLMAYTSISRLNIRTDLIGR